jgi:hypothetical protein
VIALALGALVLAGCTNSAPPAAELADEMIDTLDVPDSVKACMKSEVEGFQLTEEEAQGFDDLDAVAEAADDGQQLALAIMDRFEQSLEACNAAG